MKKAATEKFNFDTLDKELRELWSEGLNDKELRALENRLDQLKPPEPSDSLKLRILEQTKASTRQSWIVNVFSWLGELRFRLVPVYVSAAVLVLFALFLLNDNSELSLKLKTTESLNEKAVLAGVANDAEGHHEKRVYAFMLDDLFYDQDLFDSDLILLEGITR